MNKNVVGEPSVIRPSMSYGIRHTSANPVIKPLGCNYSLMCIHFLQFFAGNVLINHSINCKTPLKEESNFSNGHLYTTYEPGSSKFILGIGTTDLLSLRYREAKRISYRSFSLHTLSSVQLYSLKVRFCHAWYLCTSPQPDRLFILLVVRQKPATSI